MHLLISYRKFLFVASVASLLILGGLKINTALAVTVPKVFDFGSFAWSGNIGWISFNCHSGGPTHTGVCGTSNYKVSVTTSGTVTGYAWSPNIGWIKFGGLHGFPTGGGTVATNARVTGTYPNFILQGWARACSATVGGNCSSMATNPTAGGWDGWISLGGTGYNIKLNNNSMTAHSFAWGGPVIGWINFSTVTNTQPSVTMTGTNCHIPIGGHTCNGSLTWRFTNTTKSNIFNRTTNKLFNSQTSGTSKPVSLRPGANLLQARANTTVVGTKIMYGICATGSHADTTKIQCVGTPPAITISTKPVQMVRRGTPVHVTWTINPTLAEGTCTVTGGGLNQSTTKSGTATSQAIDHYTKIIIKCTGSYGTVEKSVIVEVVPSAQEI